MPSSALLDTQSLSGICMCLLEKVQKEEDCTDPVLQLLEFAGLSQAVCKEAQSPPAAGGVGWGEG